MPSETGLTPNNETIDRHNQDGQTSKTKQRISDHGEVFTNEREANSMLDLVKNETERIDSRFLEPACGNGNFLAVVLRCKLAVVSKILVQTKI
jgi:hypothetical protein